MSADQFQRFVVRITTLLDAITVSHASSADSITVSHALSAACSSFLIMGAKFIYVAAAHVFCHWILL